MRLRWKARENCFFNFSAALGLQIQESAKQTNLSLGIKRARTPRN